MGGATEPTNAGCPLMKQSVTAVLYLLFSVLYTALFSHETSFLGAAIKVAPILLLAASAWRWADAGWRRALTAALLFSALGDLLLALNGLMGDLFIAGLGSFLLGQILYASVFWRHPSPDRWRRWLVLAYLPCGAVLSWQMIPASGNLALPVGLYLLGISAMITGAALTDRPLLLFAGALCFAVSDGLLATDRFLQPVPAAGILIMGTYYLAQGLICVGALQAPRRHAA